MGEGERNEWGERRCLKQSDGEHRPKAMSYEVQDRGACSQNGADGKFCSKGLQTIRYTPGNWPAYQSHCGCPTKHEPEFLRPKPAIRKKGRQEGRGTSKRTEKCAVQQHKSKQDGPLYCHGSLHLRQGAIAKFRNRLDWIYRTYFTGEEHSYLGRVEVCRQ